MINNQYTLSPLTEESWGLITFWESGYQLFRHLMFVAIGSFFEPIATNISSINQIQEENLINTVAKQRL
jgi:hypothetical protein